MKQINVNCFDTIDYKLFKLLQEISYVDTFGKDEIIRKKYKQHLMEKYKNDNRRQTRKGISISS
jgi:hypothetical protein